jgi:hypothetical protein
MNLRRWYIRKNNDTRARNIKTKCDFVETCFTGQMVLIVSQHAVTSNSAQSNSRVPFQRNVVKVSFMLERTCNFSALIFLTFLSVHVFIYSSRKDSLKEYVFISTNLG